MRPPRARAGRGQRKDFREEAIEVFRCLLFAGIGGGNR